MRRNGIISYRHTQSGLYSQKLPRPIPSLQPHNTIHNPTEPRQTPKRYRNINEIERSLIDEGVIECPGVLAEDDGALGEEGGDFGEVY